LQLTTSNELDRRGVVGGAGGVVTRSRADAACLVEQKPGVSRLGRRTKGSSALVGSRKADIEEAPRRLTWYAVRVRIVVCDVGVGNLRSVERALLEASKERGTLGRDHVEVTRDPARLADADALVMPGQGGFGDCSRALSGALGDAVREHLATERPYLGICLGLQVLFGSSEEAPGCGGLGMLEGKVVKLRDGLDAVTGAPLKIPHTGWNQAEATDNHGLLKPAGAGPAEHFYFVHSFVVVPTDPAIVASRTEYGERFVSSIAYGNVFACQFHPEKSQRAGIALLQRFLGS
jgi:glutamine amidotransferase